MSIGPWLSLPWQSVYFFLGYGHDLLGPHLTDENLNFLLDKWREGPLRVINLVAFAMLFYWLRRFVYPVVQMEPFLTLGKASLEVFCAHLVFVFIALALLFNDVTELHGPTAIIALVVTFVGLFMLAASLVRRREEARTGNGSTPSN